MKITSDPAKREITLRERGLDLEADSAIAFAGVTFTVVDDRRDYGEVRYQSYAALGERVVMIVWTPRGDARHVISMRYCHEKEARRYRDRMG